MQVEVPELPVEEDDQVAAEAAQEAFRGELLELAWSGIGANAQGYFADSDALESLAEELRPRLAQAVVLRVHYDSATFVGNIRLQLAPGDLVQPLATGEGWVAPGGLVPLTRALADYRDEVGGRFDIRLLSFGIGIDLLGVQPCGVEVGGELPPDGSELATCLHLGGEQLCGQAQGQRLVFSAADWVKVGPCFGVP